MSRRKLARSLRGEDWEDPAALRYYHAPHHHHHHHPRQAEEGGSSSSNLSRRRSKTRLVTSHNHSNDNESYDAVDEHRPSSRVEGVYSGCLPQELAWSIFARLPLPKLFELRTLSKAWKVELESYEFLMMQQKQAAEKGGEEAWLVMGMRARRVTRLVSAKEFIAYIPSLHKWIHLPLHSLLGVHAKDVCFCVNHWDFLSPSSFLLAGGNGGLLCAVVKRPCTGLEHRRFIHDIHQDRKYVHPHFHARIVVFNPLTHQARTLPPLPPSLSDRYSLTERNSISIFQQDSSHTFKVVVSFTFTLSYALGFVVYNSQSNSWQAVASIGRMYIFDWYPSDQIIYSRHDIQNADLLCVVPSLSNQLDIPFVCGYHLNSHHWSCIPLPIDLLNLQPPAEGLGFDGVIKRFKERSCVMNCDGRVVLVVQMRNQEQFIQGFEVYLLSNVEDIQTSSWKRVGVTPQNMWSMNTVDDKTHKRKNDTRHRPPYKSHKPWEDMQSMSSMRSTLCDISENDDESEFSHWMFLPNSGHDTGPSRDDYHRWSEVTFTHSRNLICMTCMHHTDHIRRFSGRCALPLVFNLDKDAWYFLPPYNGKVKFMGLFSFKPSLTPPP